MKKKDFKLTNQETLEIISRSFITKKEFQMLANVGRTKLYEMCNEIYKEIEQSGMKIPPNGYIPTKKALEYLGIDEKRIIRFAKLEKELNL